MRYLVGVDLGRDTDYTAIEIAEQVMSESAVIKEQAGRVYGKDAYIEMSLRVVYVDKVPLRTSYVAVANKIAGIMRNPKIAGRARLILDATGVGAPVVDLLRAMGVVGTAVKITAGQDEHVRDGYVTVPKTNLIDAVITLMHTGRLGVASGVKYADELRKQLVEYQAVQRNGTVQYNNRLDTIHDDLVIALSLCCWAFTRESGGVYRVKPTGQRKREYTILPFRRGDERDVRSAGQGARQGV